MPGETLSNWTCPKTGMAPPKMPPKSPSSPCPRRRGKLYFCQRCAHIRLRPDTLVASDEQHPKYT
eukprot:3041584-Pyramimonas_sp.AAC.1